ncbi:MAG: phosphoribosyl-AMP cyclohydrolase [Spirochaetes bacterium DG_61]|jgi:phosphoribosyl-AMP cyclohydrolase|nr:MAG: phosphoribosyl-AMP cyclohydrolase [Spirochaetes bacterium DG_61]
MIELDFDKAQGLIPAVAQDYESGEVLMVAYMNRIAWERTLSTGYAHYWSRSRQSLWKKGEVSGNVQEIKEIRIDCDADSILLRIRQIGGATCHTGHRSCFYRKVTGGRLVTEGEKIFEPKQKYGGSSKRCQGVEEEGS